LNIAHPYLVYPPFRLSTPLLILAEYCINSPSLALEWGIAGLRPPTAGRLGHRLVHGHPLLSTRPNCFACVPRSPPTALCALPGGFVGSPGVGGGKRAVCSRRQFRRRFPEGTPEPRRLGPEDQHHGGVIVAGLIRLGSRRSKCLL
jgi:hypothetical protein